MSQADIILAHRVRRLAEQAPDFDVVTFVEHLDDGGFEDQPRSFRQLWENGQRFASHLLDGRTQPGESFAIVMQNHPEFVELMVAASITGTVFVPVDPRTRGETLAYMLDHAGCTGAVVADYAWPNLRAVLDRLPGLRWICVVGESEPETVGVETLTAAELLSAPLQEHEVVSQNPADRMQLMYTSGTTGKPKAISSPHARMAVADMLPKLLGLTPDDRPYTGLSFTHANAQLITLGMSLYGQLPCVISRTFTKSRLWDLTRRYDCTVFNLLGGMTTALYSEPRRDDDADNPVRLVISAGVPAALWKQFEERFGLRLFEIYGAAEGGMTFNPPGVGPVGSIGKPPPTMQLRIVDENDEECEPGTPGEIVFRNADGSTPAVAYYRDPQATADKTRGGWLRMGDIGYVDAEGWAYFLYRSGGGIRRNGEFIDPAPIEKLIAEMDAVDDVFVYGAATGSNSPGEKEIVAAIVPADRESFRPADVFAACGSRLNSNHVPGFVQVVREIPKTASEKPLERRLLESFTADAEDVVANPASQRETQ